MKRTTVAIAVGALLIGGGTTAYAATSTGVPDAIKVPEGNKRLATYRGEGVQIYGCTNGAWTLIQPAATLSHRGRTIALHSKGPVWTSTVDGSTVGAAAVPGASVPRPNAVPELLLKANLNSGDGIFGKVTYVQRLDTRGGLAPAGTCAAGAQTAVRYSADYAFWVAK
ncbi:DUF3455 domain-containing protein [Amycolatopsis azurea]|uniref:Tat pathway signal sequence domain protein n=1 Tax=Amycolatopsis azurea DSM 43854 TaxID=1238180 RepID=M2QQ75_9PSEU|nr:DUF3455 domain-containing protein [Amycolatopsis azurea]EMD27947.1 hypothetical protein C791_1844 [Amycolatopsis azurea DSM 43854]OOC03414.1 Tat pathway signal sequence domain protein [Amycolatopsis azurea DSM 43854]